MKISEELSEKIITLIPQLKKHKGIRIGYSHPLGCFSEEEDDFLIYQDGELLDFPEIKYGNIYIVEVSEMETEVEGIFIAHNYNWNEITDKIVNFLIDFHSWIIDGSLVFYPWKKFKHYRYLNLGDGRWEVQTRTSSYCRVLDDLPGDLLEHILGTKVTQ